MTLHMHFAATLLLAGALMAGQAGADQSMPQHSMPMGANVAPQAASADDTRPLVKLTPETIDLLRADMRQMMSALSQVLGLLAEGKNEDAARLLEHDLGMPAMQTHPGMIRATQELPETVRMLGMGMHRSASELAQDLATAQPTVIYRGLQLVAAACTACHMAYRVR